MNGCEYWIYVRDNQGEEGATRLPDDWVQAWEIVKRVLDQFVCEGYVIFTTLVQRNAWVAQRDEHYAVVQLITTSVN